MRKQTQNRIFVLMIVGILVCSAAVFGFLAAQNEPRIVEKEPEASSSAIPAGVDDVKITEETRVQWDYFYEKCAHHVYVHCQADEDMVGLSFTQFQKQYPEIQIVEFDPHELVLKKTFECYCPNHFILTKYKNELAIYTTKLGSNKQEMYMRVPIAFDDLESHAQEVLSVGKVFSELEDVENYLEDIET